MCGYWEGVADMRQMPRVEGSAYYNVVVIMDMRQVSVVEGSAYYNVVVIGGVVADDERV